MSQTYVLHCSCGAEVAVDVRQAGETARCTCGRTVDVPKLRELRRLEPLLEQTPDPRRASWSVLQGGLFVAGLLAIAIAAGSGFYVWSQQRRYDTSRPDVSKIRFQYDMSTIPLVDSWTLWKKEYVEARIDQRPTPMHVRARAKVVQLNRWLKFFGVVAGLGVVAMVASFVVRPRRPAG